LSPRGFSLLLCTAKRREVRLFVRKATSGVVALHTPEVKMPYRAEKDGAWVSEDPIFPIGLRDVLNLRVSAFFSPRKMLM
jgi:hypothetical protein